MRALAHVVPARVAGRFLCSKCRFASVPGQGGAGAAAAAAAAEAFAPLTSWEHLGDNFTAQQLSVTKGFKEPSPIQAQSWPIALAGRDMVGIGARAPPPPPARPRS